MLKPSPETSMWDAYAANPTDETRNALVVYYMPLAESLVRHVLRLGWFRPPTDEDELLSVAYETLLTTIGECDPTRGARAFLRRAIRNDLLDYGKKLEAGQQREEFPAADSTDASNNRRNPSDRKVVPTPSSLGLEVADATGVTAEWLDAIESLPEEPRVILEMLVQGLTQKEVGEYLGVSQQAISRKLANVVVETAARIA